MNHKHTAANGTTAASAITLAALGHGLPGLVIAAVVLIATRTITALAPYLFWLCALAQPARDLRRARRHATTTDQHDHLLTWLGEQRRAVLAARASGDAGPNDRSAKHTEVRR